MNSLGVDNISIEKANVEVNDNLDGGVKVSFSGDIDLQYPEAIFSPFFNQIHNKIIESEIKKVELDFMLLTFLNSSGIKTIIKWITQVTALPPDQKYTFDIVANSNITWQETSLKMLSLLAPGLINLVVK
ncbi:MAG: hypothetical protein MJB14_08520 [Spirochaetes bacterium]|nr:hypothetical protein [Spirochaetota bacterium]